MILKYQLQYAQYIPKARYKNQLDQYVPTSILQSDLVPVWELVQFKTVVFLSIIFLNIISWKELFTSLVSFSWLQQCLLSSLGCFPFREAIFILYLPFTHCNASTSASTVLLSLSFAWLQWYNCLCCRMTSYILYGYDSKIWHDKEMN